MKDEADDLIREALDKLENLIVFFGDVPLTEKLSDIRDDLNGALSLEADVGLVRAVPCPGCDYSANTNKQMLNHVCNEHPEILEEEARHEDQELGSSGGVRG